MDVTIDYAVVDGLVREFVDHANRLSLQVLFVAACASQSLCQHHSVRERVLSDAAACRFS